MITSRSCSFMGELWLVLTFVALSQYACATTRLDMSKQTVIAERSGEKGVRIVLAVDQDDIVHEIAFGLPDSKGKAVVEANLGMRVTNSGSLSLARVLPKDKVPVFARRVTLADGTTIHTVLAWGFSEFPNLLLSYSHVYIFREHHGEVSQIVSQGLGPELEQVVVEDINGDGNVEILVVTRENADSSMNIWQIHPDGQVEKIQRIDGYEVHTVADRFLDQQQGILVEEKIIGRSGCVKIDEYVWSDKARRFVKK